MSHRLASGWVEGLAGDARHAQSYRRLSSIVAVMSVVRIIVYVCLSAAVNRLRVSAAVPMFGPASNELLSLCRFVGLVAMHVCMAYM